MGEMRAFPPGQARQPGLAGREGTQFPHPLRSHPIRTIFLLVTRGKQFPIS